MSKIKNTKCHCVVTDKAEELFVKSEKDPLTRFAICTICGHKRVVKLNKSRRRKHVRRADKDLLWQ